MRLLLAARAGAPMRDAGALAIDRTCTQCGEQHGQPRVDGLSISSSTSGPHVLVAVGDADGPVGVDVEVVPDALWTGFDAYALHPDERGSMPEGADGISQRIRAWAQNVMRLSVKNTTYQIDSSSTSVVLTFANS